MRRVVLGVAVASALVGAASPARAEPPAPPADKAPADAPPEPVEVRVIGAKPDSLQRIPGSGDIVTTKDLERTQPADAAEILRRVPGLQVRQEEGGGFRLDIGIRGLDPGRSRRVLMLEDGIPMAINPYAESDMYHVPAIERMRGIEVVKGSGAILFGPQTTGGVINFLTLAPPAHPTAVFEAWGGTRDYGKVLAMYGDSAGPVRYLVQAFHKEGSGFRDEAFASTDVFGKMAFDTGKRGEATLKLGFHDDRAYSDDLGLTAPMFATTPERPTLAPYDRMKLQRYEVSLTHEERFDKDTKLKTLLYAYQTWRIWRRQNYTRSPQDGVSYEHVAGDTTIPNGAIFFQWSDTILDRTYDVAGVEPKLEHRFLTGNVGHTVELGTRVLAETAHYQQRQGDFPQSESGSLQQEETHRTYAFAAYAQDRVALTERLLVTPGVRFEYANFRRDTLRQLVGAAPADEDQRGYTDSAALIPGFGAIYGERAAHVFAGVHVGYAPPRLTDSISPKGDSIQLSPERSYNYEVGTRFTYKKAWRFEGTGFYSHYTNQVVAGAGSDTTTLVNGGSTEHYGVEAATTLEVAKLLWGARTKTALDLGLRYTYAHASFLGGQYDGKFLPYAPEHTGGATVDFVHPVGFGAQVSWYTVGPEYTDQANTVVQDVTGRVGKIPAYNVLDLNARYRHAPTGLTLKLLVKGALNDIYIQTRRPEGIHAAGFREILLGLRWDYEKRPAEARGAE